MTSYVSKMVQDMRLKMATSYFLNNLIKNEPIWTIFGTHNPEDILHNCFEPAHHTWKMLLLYLVKSKSITFNSSSNWTCCQSMKLRLFFSPMKKWPSQLPRELTKLLNIQGGGNQKHDMSINQLLYMHPISPSATSVFGDTLHIKLTTYDIFKLFHKILKRKKTKQYANGNVG